MNRENISPVGIAEFKFFRQALVERSYTLWGNEIRVECTSDLYNASKDVHILYHQRLECAYSEALRRMTPRPTIEAKKLPPAMCHPATHQFLRIDQSALMHEDTLKNLVQTSNTLDKQKQQLVISIDNALDALPGPAERRAMVRQLYNLKDRSGIKVAYNNYTLDTKPADLLIELKLYDYIKMPFPDAALRLSLNTRSDLFDRLYDRMLELKSAIKVSFIADNVEFADSALLARRLPFDYFQGGYYSPAESL